MCVLEEMEYVEDGGNFCYSCGDDVPGEGDVADGCPQKLDATIRSARDTTVERVEKIGVGGCADVDERF